jgi:hypothetical protein
LAHPTEKFFMVKIVRSFLGAWFIFSGWGLQVQGENFEELIWTAQTPAETAQYVERIQTARAGEGRPGFPFNHDQLQVGVGALPTDPKTGVGGCQLDIYNWTGKPIRMEMRGVLRDYYGKLIERFSGPLELAKDKTEKKTFTFPVTTAKRHRLVVTFTDLATATSREMRFYPQLDCFSGLRKEISLNGTWKVLPTEKADYPPAGKEAWKDITVPQPFGMGFEKFLWVSRTFSVPTVMKGTRLVLRFEAIGHNAAVFINGKNVGRSDDAYVPFEMDVTEAIKFDGENTVMVRISKADRVKEKDGQERSIQPWAVGEGLGCYDVRLYTRPAVFIADRFVRTSFRNKTIEVTTWITNNSSSPAEVELRTTVLDGDRAAKTLKPLKVVIQPGEIKAVESKEAWENPHLWWPYDPFFYLLRSELATGETVSDRADLRFGFREIWCQGTKLILNGKDAWLRRYSEIIRWCGAIVPEKMSILFSDLQAKDYNTLRFHMEPPPEYCVETADEMGMLVVIEAGLYNGVTAFAMETDAYWQNVKKHLQGLVKLYRNHPSVIMYSPENEWAYINISGIYPALFPKHFPDMSRDIKAMDPTRPLCYDSDDDASGTADTRGLHYPQDWDARWPLPNHAFFNLGKKPVILGEFMMSEGMIGRQDNQIFGDRCLMPPVCSGVKAYHVGQDNHNPYMRKTIAMFCDAYRLHGVAGLNPWFFREETWGLMPAVLVTAKHLPNGFTGGSVREVPLHVLYDIFEDQKITLQVYLEIAGHTPQITTTTLNMIGGQRPEVMVKIAAPAVKTATPCNLVFKVLSEKGKVLFNRRRAATIFPNQALTTKASSVLFDPAGKVPILADVQGMVKLEDLSRFDPSAKLLILGPGAGSRLSREERVGLETYVQKGGKVFVMAQGSEGKFLPVQLPLDEGYRHTFAFVRAANHPVMIGLRDCDFAGWGPENWVVRQGSFLKPDVSNSVILVESGDTGGLSYAPMVEVRRGQGSYILCQLAMAENSDEPAVRYLFQNILNYAEVSLPALQDLYVLKTVNPKTTALLGGLGAKIQIVTGQSVNPGTGVVLVEGADKIDPSTVEWLKTFAEAGGTVWLHRLIPEALPKVKPLVGAIRLKKIEAAGTNVGFATVPADKLIRAGTPPLLDGIGQTELTGKGIADYAVENVHQAGGRTLTVPAGLVVYERGKGRVLIDQINWQEDRRILFPLLTHLNINLGARQVYLPTRLYRPVDLSNLAKTNAPEKPVIDALKELLTVPADPKTASVGTPILDRKEFSGIPFLATAIGSRVQKPLRIELDNTKAQTIVFLYASTQKAPANERVGEIVLEYADGTRAALPILMNKHIGPLLGVNGVSLKESPLMWQSTDTKTTMYGYEWKQPHSGKEIKALTLEGNLVVGGITLANEVMQTSISPASATYLKNGKRKESGSSIVFHRTDQIIWSLDFITLGTYWIALTVRTGNGGPTDMMAGYHLKLNGREIPLADPMLPISLGASASDASWKDWRGTIRVKVPVSLKVGDKLKLTTQSDWSSVDLLALDMLTRLEETQQRDGEYKAGKPKIYDMTLDLVRF